MNASYTLAVALSLILTGRDGAPDGKVTAEQFLRFIKVQRSAIRDFAFAFEGEHQFLGPKDEKATPLIKFQGRYALRSDGAAFLEHYYEGRDVTLAHPVRTKIHGESEMAYITPAWEADPRERKRIKNSGGGPFFDFHSPETWNFLWRFQTLMGPSDFGYIFLGWEDIDGHRCAHIEFVPHPKYPGPARQELWVDLERGAHPLRIKNCDGTQTVYLIDEIRLMQFTLPSGEIIWFPVGGQFNGFFHEGQYTDEPAFRVTSYALNDTLFFNQGLGDGVFRVQGEQFRPTFQRKQAAPLMRPNKKRPTFDLVDAEKQLDVALAEPSRRRLTKDASLSTREESSYPSRAAWGLGLGGVAVLFVAGLIALRRRVGGRT